MANNPCLSAILSSEHIGIPRFSRILFMWGTLRGTFLRNLGGNPQRNNSRFASVLLPVRSPLPLFAKFNECLILR